MLPVVRVRPDCGGELGRHAPHESMCLEWVARPNSFGCVFRKGRTAQVPQPNELGSSQVVGIAMPHEIRNPLAAPVRAVRGSALVVLPIPGRSRQALRLAYHRLVGRSRGAFFALGASSRKGDGPVRELDAALQRHGRPRIPAGGACLKPGAAGRPRWASSIRIPCWKPERRKNAATEHEPTLYPRRRCAPVVGVLLSISRSGRYTGEHRFRSYSGGDG